MYVYLFSPPFPPLTSGLSLDSNYSLENSCFVDPGVVKCGDWAVRLSSFKKDCVCLMFVPNRLCYLSCLENLISVSLCVECSSLIGILPNLYSGSKALGPCSFPLILTSFGNSITL